MSNDKISKTVKKQGIRCGGRLRWHNTKKVGRKSKGGSRARNMDLMNKVIGIILSQISSDDK